MLLFRQTNLHRLGNAHCLFALQWRSELARSDLNLVGIAIKRAFQFSEGSRLYLVCVLQLLNPFSLFRFQTCNLAFDLHSLLVFFVDSADEFLALLLTLLVFLHEPLLCSFVFLISNHLFHALGFQLFGTFLDAYHFLVLLTLLF